jgi:hypothetical protein
MTPLSFVHLVVCPSSLYGQTYQWTKEKEVIRGHKEKKGRQANGQKRQGTSEVIKRRTDNPMTTFSFVHWVVCPSLKSRK